MGLLLFELACIRWLPANLRMLSFFSNFVLLACFLGMSVGLLLPPGRRLLGLTVPLLAGVAGILASLDLGVTLEPAHAAGSIYFGAEFLSQAGLNLPFWALLTPVFLLVTALFVGPGAEMGRLFSSLPPLRAYSLNVAGSIAGILAFMGMSALSLGPLAWFSVAGLLFAWLLRDRPRLAVTSVACLAAALGLVHHIEAGTMWSPYNRIRVEARRLGGVPTQLIHVNGITHQEMYPNGAAVATFYDIPYLIRRLDRPDAPAGDVLVIGAGSGNDVSHALKNGASNVEAVEIDPRIQELGRRLHPDLPYSDPRVHAVVNDGRAYLGGTDRKFDLILYAYVDSLSLLSQFGAVRLENYLFTREALEDVRDHLAPDGVFAAYNSYREAWLSARIYRLLQEVFGEDRVVFLTFPAREHVAETDEGVNLALFMAGDVGAVREQLAKGVVLPPQAIGGAPLVLQSVQSVQVADLEPTTDDWPFPYVRRPEIPLHNVQAAGLVLVLATVLLGATGTLKPGASRLHFFLLGCAFMLIETRGIARLALLFGSTWTSNSLTFLAILSLILAANVVAARVRSLRHEWLYAGLLASLAVDAALPFGMLLSLGPVLRAGAGCLVLFVPIFFAGLIFARSFRDSESPSQDLGANVLGAMVGGCLENLSLVLGYRWLVLVGAALYVGSWLAVRKRSEA